MSVTEVRDFFEPRYFPRPSDIAEKEDQSGNVVDHRENSRAASGSDRERGQRRIFHKSFFVNRPYRDRKRSLEIARLNLAIRRVPISAEDPGEWNLRSSLRVEFLLGSTTI